MTSGQRRPMVAYFSNTEPPVESPVMSHHPDEAQSAHLLASRAVALLLQIPGAVACPWCGVRTNHTHKSTCVRAALIRDILAVEPVPGVPPWVLGSFYP
jgi:hypothetical protein